MAKRVALFQELFVTEFRRRHPELGADATELEALLRRCVTSWWNFMLASPSVRTALARELRHALTRAPDDPLILLCAAVATRADGKQAMAEQLFNRALADFEAHDAPAWARYLTVMCLLRDTPQKAGALPSTDLGRKCSRYLLEMAVDPTFGGTNQRIFVDLVKQLFGGDIPAGAEDFVLALERTPGVPPLTLKTLRGLFWVAKAWKLRSSKAAKDVTEEGWIGFEEALAKARQDLEAAYQLDPGAPEAAAKMISVCGGSDDDPKLLERWFARAVAAEVDYFGAYSGLLNFLLPRWGGSHARMLAFAKQWAASGRFDTFVPDMYRYALVMIAKEYPKLEDLYASAPLQKTLAEVHKGYLAQAADSKSRARELSQQVIVLALGGRVAEAAELYSAMDLPFEDDTLGRYGRTKQWLTRALRPHLVENAVKTIDSRDVFAGYETASYGAGTEPRALPHGNAAAALPRFRSKQDQWTKRVLLDAYAKHGHHDAKWDAKVTALLGDYPAFVGQDGAEARSFCDRALALVDAGCDDPLFRYVTARACERGGDPERARKLLEEATNTLAGRGCPDLFVFFAKRRLEALRRAADEIAEADQLARELGDHVVAMAKHPMFASADARMFVTTIASETEIGWKVPVLTATVVSRLAEDPSVDAWLRHMVQGLHHAAFVTGTPFDFSPKGRVVEYAEHWRLANEHLRAAYALHPEFPEAAAALIPLAALESAGVSPRTWFERAVAVCVDHPAAYTNFAITLRPEWGGSIQALYRFGVECLETALFDTDVPLRFRSAVLTAAFYVGNTRQVWVGPKVAMRYSQLVDGVTKARPGSAVAKHLEAGRLLTDWAGGRLEQACKAWDAAQHELDQRWLELLRTQKDTVSGELAAFAARQKR